MEIIKAENLSFRYEDDQSGVIDNLSFEIEEGDFVAILGHNGSGKSTLAKLFSGILSPVSGKLTVAGHDVSDQEHLFELRSSVGMVFQNPDNQIISSIVEEDVAFALENLGVPYEEMRRKVDEALESVGMGEYKKHSTTKLSGGQKQRLCIARAMLKKPSILILDDSTSAVDTATEAKIRESFYTDFKDTTVILIAQRISSVMSADRILVLDNGEIVAQGNHEELMQSSEEYRDIYYSQMEKEDGE